MVAKIIDGKAVAQHVRQECKLQTQALKAQGVTPGLAVIIVGDNPASKVYVANKVRACTEVGLVSTVYAFAADTPDQEVLDKILAHKVVLMTIQVPTKMPHNKLSMPTSINGSHQEVLHYLEKLGTPAD